MSLGERLSRLRAQRGLSQSELAERLEVSRQSVSKWETDGAVPDLDKLVKLAQVFGVTLDELVLGIEKVPEEKTEEETPPAPAMSEPPRSGWPGRKIAGVILFCMGFLVFLILTLLGGAKEGLVLASPFLLCGAICFIAKKRPGLWCGWLLFILAYVYLRYATGVEWGMAMYTLRYLKWELYAQLIMAWVEVLFLVALVIATVQSFREMVLPWDKKGKTRLAIGWVALVLLELLPRIVGRVMVEHIDWFSMDGRMTIQYILTFLAWGRVALFTLLLVLTLAALRGRKKTREA